MRTKKHIVYDFLEPDNGPIGLMPRPLSGSSDNAILFSVIAHHLFIPLGDMWLVDILRSRRIEPGKFKRHPHETWSTQWDDHLAIALLGYGWAEEIYEYGNKHNWIWSDMPSLWDTLRAYGIRGTFARWLGRIILFRSGSTLARRRPGTQWVHMCLLSLPYLWNSFEDRRATSGKQLLWLTSELLLRKLELRWWNPLYWAHRFWLYRMGKIYPAGPYQMLRYYYWECEQYHGLVHPIALYSPRSW